MYDFFVVSSFSFGKSSFARNEKKKSGRIINITSEVFHCSVPEFSAYVAAKGGQIGWSRRWPASWLLLGLPLIRLPRDGSHGAA